MIEGAMVEGAMVEEPAPSVTNTLVGLKSGTNPNTCGSTIRQ